MSEELIKRLAIFVDHFKFADDSKRGEAMSLLTELAAITQQTEPVAWMRHRVMSGHGFGGGVVCEFSEQKFSDINDPEAEIEPLYTAPQSGVREVNADTVSVPSEKMLDSVRGVLQMLRGKPGVTFPEVIEHCKMRGDNAELFPVWAMQEKGYVTEQGAAWLIWDVMRAAQEGEK